MNDNTSPKEISRDWLPSHRNFVTERSDAEREHGIQWTGVFSVQARRRIFSVLNESYNSSNAYIENTFHREMYKFVEKNSRLGLEANSLGEALQGNAWDVSDIELVDWLAAAPIVLGRLASELNGRLADDGEYTVLFDYSVEHFVSHVDEVLLDERIDYAFVDQRLMPRSDAPMHLEIVKPLAVLLTADPRFAEAEKAYGDATSSMAAGHYGAAITSMGSCLQESLEALGAQGNDLTALVNSGKKKGLFQGHDEKLFDIFKLVAGWVTADRSNRGTAHGPASANADDAMLALHVVGAFVLRLSRLRPADE